MVFPNRESTVEVVPGLEFLDGIPSQGQAQSSVAESKIYFHIPCLQVTAMAPIARLDFRLNPRIRIPVPSLPHPRFETNSARFAQSNRR
jgi:hypothetical protein